MRRRRVTSIFGLFAQRGSMSGLWHHPMPRPYAGLICWRLICEARSIRAVKVKVR